MSIQLKSSPYENNEALCTYLNCIILLPTQITKLFHLFIFELKLVSHGFPVELSQFRSAGGTVWLNKLCFYFSQITNFHIVSLFKSIQKTRL